MKKRIWIPIATAVILLAILFVPIPQSPYQDGGTREWISLTYKIVKWNRLSVDGIYEKVRIYGPADKGKSIDELWKLEEEIIEAEEAETEEPTILLIKILVIQIILPAIVTLAISEFMRKKGWIKFGDMALEGASATQKSIENAVESQPGVDKVEKED